MAKRTNMMVPADWKGQDKRFAESIKETVDCLVGQRGDPLDKAVTVKDLLGSGLAVLPAGGAYSGVPNDLTPPPPDTSVPNIGTPPAPTNLTASGSFQNILLAWNLEIYAGHSAVEVYRHTSDSITDSTLVGRASGRVGIFSDSVGGGSTFYYWVRAVNQNGDFGPYNSSSGTAGTTQPDVDILLDELTDQITDTQLATDLSTSITLITAPSNVTGSVANRILAESNARALAVSGEASARAAGFIAEATARTSAIAVETVARNSAIQAEQTARISAIATESTNRANALASEASTRATDISAETSARVAAVSSEVTARGTAIAAEATARASAISASATALQNQINDLLDIAPYDASVSYVTNDQVTYLGKLYKASQATTGNLPTNTTYWTLLGNYSSLGDLVGSNTSAITAINTVSASSTSAAAQAINSLNSTVNDANTGVSATSSALDAVETLVNNSSTGVTASANKISALESTVNNSSTGVAATAGQMDVVETLVNNTSTGVAASATKISALETTVNDSSTGVAATSGALDTVETLVNNSSTGVAASATKISALETTVNNATTGVAATSGALDTVETLVNHSDTGVAASATKISALETTVNDSSTGVSATSNALDTVETLVNNSSTGVAASATKISALETTVNNATTGVAATSGALDTVETLVNHSDTGVAASATKISALETTVNDPNTGVSATSSALDTVETLVNNSSTGVAASATKIGLLETTVNNGTTGVAATSSALDTVETLVNNSDTGVAASASKISALETTVNNATTGVAATSGALDTVETLVNNSDTGVTASANKISALETTVNDPSTGVSATSGALDTVETLVNDSGTGVTASANKISALETTVNDAATGVSATSGALDTVETLVNDSGTGVTASANKISALETTVNDATTGVSATSGALDTVEALVNNSSTGVSATATKVSNLETTVNGANGDDGLAANFAVLNTAVIDSESGLAATANSLSGLVAIVGDSTAGLVQSVGAISSSSGASATDISNLIASLNTLNDESDTSLNAAVLSERSVRVSAEGATSELVTGISSSLTAKTQTFAQDDVPVSLAVGDLWIDTNDNNKLYRATSIGANEVASNEWVTVRDTTATTTTFSQDNAPTSVTIGDLWIDTNDQNKVYRAESVGANEVASGEWVLLDLGQALASASAITVLNTEVGIDGSGSASRIDNIFSELDDPASGTTAVAEQLTTVKTEVFPNGTASSSKFESLTASVGLKPNTFAQDNAPTATAIGDLWIDTNDNNKLYRAESVGANEVTANEWVAINDTTPTTTTFTGSSAPTAITIGDLWVNTENDSSGNPKNHLYRAESVGADEIAAGEWVFFDLGQAVSTAGVVSLIDANVFPNGSSSASSTDQISARLNDANGNSSAVTLEQQFVANANSLTDLGGQYSVKIDTNGHVAGFGLSNTDVDGTPASAFIIRADKFAIIDPDSTADGLGTLTPNSDNIPFVFTSGESASASNGNVAVPAGVYMNAAYIKNGSITTAQIGTATIGTAQITGTLSANQIDSNTIAANSIDASKLNIDGSSITSVAVNGVPTLQLGDVNVNKLTGTSISASIMSGTSVFANKLSGDVNTLVPFRTFVTQQYGGSETTMVETELPASSHPDGHKPFAIATGYIQPRFERVYRFKMYMKTTTSTSNALGTPNNAVFLFSNNVIYRYIDFTGDITGSVSNGYTLTSGSKTGTVTNVSVVSGNTRLYYSGSVAFATTDSITASSGTGYQLVGESRMKAATATKMSFAVSGSKADADAGTITMKVTVTQHNSSDTSLDSFTSTVFINEVSGMIMGVR